MKKILAVILVIVLVCTALSAQDMVFTIKELHDLIITSLLAAETEFQLYNDMKAMDTLNHTYGQLGTISKDGFNETTKIGDNLYMEICDHYAILREASEGYIFYTILFPFGDESVAKASGRTLYNIIVNIFKTEGEIISTNALLWDIPFNIYKAVIHLQLGVTDDVSITFIGTDP